MENASAKHRKIFRDYLKGKIDPNFMYTEDIENFVEYSIISLDEWYSLNNYAAVIQVESTNQFSILNVISNYLLDYATKIHVDFKLVKKMYQDVKFDAKLARKQLRQSGYNDNKIEQEINFTLRKFEELKKSGQLFQMKRFVPKEIRAGFFFDFFCNLNLKKKKIYIMQH